MRARSVWIAVFVCGSVCRLRVWLGVLLVVLKSSARVPVWTRTLIVAATELVNYPAPGLPCRSPGAARQCVLANVTQPSCSAHKRPRSIEPIRLPCLLRTCIPSCTRACAPHRSTRARTHAHTLARSYSELASYLLSKGADPTVAGAWGTLLQAVEAGAVGVGTSNDPAANCPKL